MQRLREAGQGTGRGRGECRRSSPESRKLSLSVAATTSFGTTVKLAARHNPAHRQSKDEKRNEAVDEERLALVTIPEI